MRLLFFMSLLLTPLFAGQSVHVLNLKPTVENKRLTVQTQAVAILPNHLFGDRAFDLHEEERSLQYDSGFQEALNLLRVADQIRREEKPHKSRFSRVRLMTHVAVLAAYEVNGLEAGEEHTICWMGLEALPGEGFIYNEDQRYTFKLDEVTKDGPYGELLQKAMEQKHEAKGPPRLPDRDAFVIELTMTCPKPLKTSLANKALRRYQTFLRNRDFIAGLRYTLGSALIQKQADGSWRTDTNAAVGKFQEAVLLYQKALTQPPAQSAATLERYLQSAPADVKALALLMELYLADGRVLQATELFERYQPLIEAGTTRPNPSETVQKLNQAQKDRIKQRLPHFKPAPNAHIAILAPTANDLIGGLSDLALEVQNSDSRVLEVVCFLDNQRIAQLTKAPFLTRFHPPDGRRTRELRVIARFENETFVETTQTIRVLSVDAAEDIHLTPIRAVATQGKRKFRTDLEKGQLTLTENGKPQQIQHFRRETKPITMALVLDTSISMLGRKLHQAEYSLDTFIKNLEPGDRASLYTFDNRVKRLTPFQASMADTRPMIHTLTSGGGTALYDALWAAHQDLMRENGTPIIVVISDGADTGSRVKREELEALFRDSPVMVYSIILPGLTGYAKMDSALQEGRKFLETLSQNSGSVSLKVLQTAKLDETFEEIYTELKSFYYLDYQTQLPRGVPRDIQVDTDLLGTRIRFRRMDAHLSP